MKKVLLKMLTIIIFASTILTASSRISYAANDPCKPQDESFSKISLALKFLSLDTTGTGLAQTVTSTVPSIVSSGMSPNGQMSCIGILKDQLAQDGYALDALPSCVPDNENDCLQMFASYEDPATARTFDEDSLVNGSLLGFTQRAQQAFYTPVPVNLAYYFQRQMEPVPYVGPALAATSTSTYSGPYLNVVFDFWKAFRNMAYGLMGVVILITAILVATGKKIGSQTVVTVQYAIPREIIALVMITFSYPIGATIASFGYALDNSAKSIIYAAVGLPASIFLSSGVGAAQLLLTALIGAVIPATGPFVLGFAILIGVAVLVTYLLAVLKGFTLYVKMLIHIITAPFTMLRYAIPGNDGALADWFKKFIVYIGGMFGIKMGIAITNIALLRIVGDTWVAGVVWIPFLGAGIVAFIVIYGYNVARKLPDKLEASVMGKR